MKALKELKVLGLYDQYMSKQILKGYNANIIGYPSTCTHKILLKFCQKNLNSSVSIESVLLKTSKFNNHNHHNHHNHQNHQNQCQISAVSLSFLKAL